MNEWWLISAFLCLLTLAMVLLVSPFKKSSNKLFFIGLLILAAFFGYRQWGAWVLWREYTIEQKRIGDAKSLLAHIKSPEELVARLKAKLNDLPESAHGWYLLGRLYASQTQWSDARDAFAKSLSLKSGDEQVLVNYANSLWQLNRQHFNEPIRIVFVNLLRKNPDQPDALAMLAMDAWQQRHYAKAESYWRRLLGLVDPKSSEANAIREAIAKAVQKKQSSL